MVKNIYIFLSLLIIFSCKKESLLEYPETQLYTIYQNSHSSSPVQYRRIQGVNRFQISAKFLSAKYEMQFSENGELQINPNQYDWNKLSGFVDCGEQKAYGGKGALIGWRWNIEEESIELAAYVHNSNDTNFHVQKFSQTVKENEPIELSIQVDGSDYIYNLNGETIIMSGSKGRGCSGIPITGRIINPWFGGQETAPRQIKLEITYE